MNKRPYRPKDERLKDKGPKAKRYKRQKTSWTRDKNFHDKSKSLKKEK